MEFTHNMGKEDYKKIENLNKKLEQNPNNLELLMEKALIYDECYYDKETIKTYKKIIELYPNYINAYFLLSFYTTQFACNPEEGVKIAKEGLKINFKSGELHYTLASAIEILNGFYKMF